MLTSMELGGVEKSFLSLLNKLPPKKYEITVLLLEKKGDLLSYIPGWVTVKEANWFTDVKPLIKDTPQKNIKQFIKKNNLLKILSFTGVYFLSKHLDNRFFFYQYTMKNVHALTERYDIAISYQGPTDIIDYFIANKVHAKKKISWVHFDVSSHYINKNLYSKLYQSFHYIFIVSKEAKHQLIKKIPTIAHKTRVVMNVISRQTIIEMSKKVVDFDDNYKGTKIVTVGRLSKEKGQDIAIQICYQLKQLGYNIRWYCIGEGKDRKEYEDMIKEYNLKESFILMGLSVNPYPYMLKADIYVQPSRHEGYCLTLAEAKILEKPIVTTSFSGAVEQIIDGFNGLVATEEHLLEKIKFLLDNPLEREKLVGNLKYNNSNLSNKTVFFNRN